MSPTNSKWHKFLSIFKRSKTKDEKEEQNSKQEDEQKSKQKEEQNSKQKEERAQNMAFWGIGIGLGLAFAGIISYAWQAPCWAQFLSIIGVALVVANAAFFSGWLLGFLFGIPSKQAQPPVSPAPPAAPPKPPSATPQEPSAKANSSPTPSGSAATAAGQPGAYQGSTHLQEISDWLTKILVGAGLTQITALPPVLKRYAAFIAPGLGNFPHSQVLSVGLLIFFTVCGFLLGYLWTRLHFGRALSEADVEALNQVVSKVNDWEVQDKIDQKAWSIVQHHLNPVMEDISPRDLIKAITPASVEMRSRIFFLAHNVRENCKSVDKSQVEKTIPIFQALIAADDKDAYDANHAELALALKDKEVPKWQDAISELTTAIEIRNRLKEPNRLSYEFNRALCRIKKEAEDKPGQASDEKTKNDILADLKAAATDGSLYDLIAKDTDIGNWLRLNDKKLSDIKGT